MTVKKIAMSAAAVVALSTAAFAAGSLSLDGAVGKFSQELINNTAVDHNNTSAVIYECGITNATASEPGFELKLVLPATIKSTNGNISILAEDNTTIATFDRYDAAAGSIIFKKEAGASISRGLTYKIVSDNNTSLEAGAMEINVPQGATSVSAELIVTDNTGVSVIDTAQTQILTGANQFAMSINQNQKLDAQIDASAGFKNFYGDNTTQDTVGYTITNLKDTIDIPATATDMKLDIVADQNLSTYAISVAANSGNTNVSAMQKIGDYNLTAEADSATADNNFSESITSTLETDGTGAMAVTTFKATGIVAFNGFTKKLLDQADAGSWTIYGYNAQIPNVMGTGIFQTNLKFTNRSAIAAGVYFTLIDQDGTVVTVDSDNDGIASIGAGETKQYKAADLIALATAKDANFDGTKSISVEVSIPTTPNSVYGFASFKNTDLGQFKDLPIYNTSEMTY